MSTTVDQAFKRQYEREAHEAFQLKGSKLLKTVRHKANVMGKSTTFQKVGTGAATTKARHGVITPMNQDHTPIEVTLTDFFAGDYVDALDELKVNIDERKIIANGGAYALGRKIDDLIITQLDATTQTTVTWTLTSAAAVRNALLEMMEALWSNDVPMDGDCYGALTPKAWAHALTVEEFSSADYNGPDLPYANMKDARSWGGVHWIMHSGLPGQGTSGAKVFCYSKPAVGFASQNLSGDMENPQNVKAEISWHNDRDAHFIKHKMSGGCALIEDAGVIEGTLDDTAAIATS